MPKNVEVVDEQYEVTVEVPTQPPTGDAPAEAIKEVTPEGVKPPAESKDTTVKSEASPTETPKAKEIVRGAYTEKPKVKRDPATIKTLEHLASALKNDFGLDYPQQWAELNIENWRFLSITPAEAYQKIAAARL